MPATKTHLPFRLAVGILTALSLFWGILETLARFAHDLGHHDDRDVSWMKDL